MSSKLADVLAMGSGYEFINIYGLLIGIAFLTFWELSKRILQHYQQWHHKDENLIWPIALSALAGARLWHVITDWQFYVSIPKTSLYIWQGGLSIFGAVLGGLLALLIIKKNKFWLWLDAAVYGLPIGQAVGRLGNWFNEEIYGLPTNLPWKIYIKPEYRVSRFVSNDYYHPLFAYEIIYLLIIWWLQQQIWQKWPSFWQIGRGRRFIFYMQLYLVWRLCIDFLRVEQERLLLLQMNMFASNWLAQLGINQVVSLVLFLIMCGWWVWQLKVSKYD